MGRLGDYMDARVRELELRSERLIAAARLGNDLAQAAEAGERHRAGEPRRQGPDRAPTLGPEGPGNVASLVSLAGALASGDAKRIVAAGKSVAALG